MGCKKTLLDSGFFKKQFPFTLKNRRIEFIESKRRILFRAFCNYEVRKKCILHDWATVKATISNAKRVGISNQTTARLLP